MKIYVAGKYPPTAEYKRVKKLLVEAGHEITFDWSTYGWKPEAPQSHNYMAQRMLEAVTEAEALVLVVPNTSGGTGCFIEFGYALAQGKPISVYSPKTTKGFVAAERKPARSSSFWYADGVTMTFSPDEIKDWLNEQSA